MVSCCFFWFPPASCLLFRNFCIIDGISCEISLIWPLKLRTTFTFSSFLLNSSPYSYTTKQKSIWIIPCKPDFKNQFTTKSTFTSIAGILFWFLVLFLFLAWFSHLLCSFKLKLYYYICYGKSEIQTSLRKYFKALLVLWNTETN